MGARRCPCRQTPCRCARIDGAPPLFGFRLLDRFASRNIPLPILLTTEVYDHAPEPMDAARAQAAEIVGHGLINSDTLAARSEADEAASLRAVAEQIALHEGVALRGWSSPWLAQTERTFDLLGEAGYGAVLDLRLDDQPVWLTTRSKPLLALPCALELNDSSIISGRQATADRSNGLPSRHGRGPKPSLPGRPGPRWQRDFTLHRRSMSPTLVLPRRIDRTTGSASSVLLSPGVRI